MRHPIVLEERGAVMESDQHVAEAAYLAPSSSVRAEIGIATASCRAAELYAQAEAARRQSQLLAARLQAVHRASAETFRLVDAA